MRRMPVDAASDSAKLASAETSGFCAPSLLGVAVTALHRIATQIGTYQIEIFLVHSRWDINHLIDIQESVDPK